MFVRGRNLCCLLPLVLAACDGEIARPILNSPARLSTYGYVETTDATFRAVAVIRNNGEGTGVIDVVTFGCALGFQLRVPSTPQAVWDQDQHRPPLPGGCKWLPVPATIAPRDSLVIRGDVVARTVIEDSLPRRLYDAVVRLTFAKLVETSSNSYNVRVDSVAVLPAGEFAPPRDFVLYIAPQRAACQTWYGAPTTCMQARRTSSEPWQNVYLAVEGFSFEPGFSYQLLIRETPIRQAADGPSVRWQLLTVLERSPG